jgi:hypothetical protein
MMNDDSNVQMSVKLSSNLSTGFKTVLTIEHFFACYFILFSFLPNTWRAPVKYPPDITRK